MSALGNNNTQQELQLRLLKQERLALLSTIEAQEEEMKAMSAASIAAVRQMNKHKDRHEALWTAVERMVPTLANPSDNAALITYLAAIQAYKDLP